LTYAAF